MLLTTVKDYAMVRNMAAVVEQFSFPWEVPASESKKVRSKWEELKEMSALDDDESTGGLVPLNIVPILLDVSRQRVHELLTQGRFESHEFFGHKFLTVKSIAEHINTERRNGRPPKGPPETLKETISRLKARKKGQ